MSFERMTVTEKQLNEKYNLCNTFLDGIHKCIDTKEETTVHFKNIFMHDAFNLDKCFHSTRSITRNEMDYNVEYIIHFKKAHQMTQTFVTMPALISTQNNKINLKLNGHVIECYK